MTGAIRPDAELVAKLTVDDSDVPDEIRDALDRAARKNDAHLKRTGRDMGEALAEGIGKELDHQGPDLVEAVEHGLKRSKLDLDEDTWDIDPGGRVTRGWVRRIASGLKKETESDRGKSIFGQIGSSIWTAISSAVGAGFNVSGRSPLIVLLLPIIGAIVYLIGALVQAVGALIAYLYLIPSALGAILLQVGILFAAFEGVGAAIKGAFEAKNARELKEALKGLTPAAQGFVKSLLPLREIFAAIKAAAQEGFFTGFGGAITELIQAINKIGVGPIQAIAQGLGKVAGTLVAFFNNPAFQEFFAQLLPATVRWLDKFNESLLILLTGLADLGVAVAPWFEAFGEGFNEMIADFGRWLSSLKGNPEFLAFIEDAQETLADLGEALIAIIYFFKVFWQGLKEAGGDRLIQGITDFFMALAEYTASEEGQKGLQGLIHTIEALGHSFEGFITIVSALFYFLEVSLEWLRHDFYPWLDRVGVAFHDGIGNAVSAATDAVVGFVKSVGDWFSKLPGRVWNALRSFGSLIAALFMAAVKHWFDTMIRTVGVGIGALLFVVTQLPFLLLGALTALPGLLGKLWNQIWKNAVETVKIALNLIIKFITEFIPRAVSAIIGFNQKMNLIFRDLWAKINSGGEKGWNDFWNFLKSLPGRILSLGPTMFAAGLAFIRSFINGIINVGAFLPTIGDKILGYIRGPANYIIRKLNEGINLVDNITPGTLPRIPELATGGLTKSSFLAALHPNELVLPLRSPQSVELLTDALSRAVTEVQMGDTHVVVYLGTEQLDARIYRVTSEKDRTLRRRVRAQQGVVAA